MLKVYGITYDHTTNYGSCLQAYALQAVIESLSVGGEECSYRLIPLGKIRGQSERKSWKSVVKQVFTGKHYRVFQKFEDAHMKYANIAGMNELQSLNEDADAFVCGSDVIWNPLFNGGNGAYYLDFASKYKFSYAASFGKAAIEQDLLKEAARKIDALDGISVRENSGREIIRRLLNRDAEVVADPVLLLGREEWNRVATVPHADGRYIFLYTTHTTAEIGAFIEKLKRQTGLRVVVATWRGGAGEVLKQGIVNVQPPDEWLGLLRNAEYVVTNSFHATAFSVIYGKKFFTVVHGGAAEGNNIRLYDFLSSLKLEDRLISSVPETIPVDEVDYEAANARLQQMKAHSLSFLKQNLEAACERSKP